ncbi:MAG: YjjG family noncanonical pyrimidine nucleotidase [Leeuwenhoekiella sp.]
MSRLTGIEHLFFDLDHTLWDFDKNSAQAFKAIFERNRVTVPVEEFLEVYIPINFKYWKYYRENRITKEQLRYSRLAKTFAALQVKIDDQLIDRLSDDYIIYLAKYNELFDGTFEVLKELSKKYQMYIITNGFEEVQHLKLKNSKIDHFFKSVTTSQSVGVKKPDPRIFEYAMKTAGATPANSLMIGDTYEADILGAEGVGMRAVCFNYHKQDFEKAGLIIDELRQLLQLL